MIVTSESEFIKKNRAIVDLLVDNLTVDEYGVDRSIFYMHTKDMSDADRKTLRNVVEKRVDEYYKGVREVTGGSEERDRKFITKSLDSWFHPWTFLAGRMEYAINVMNLEKGYSYSLMVLKAEDLSAKLESFAAMPEYAPYLDTKMKGFAYNRCVDEELDYTKLAESLKSPDQEKIFCEKYPWLLVGDKYHSPEWDIFTEAYKAGRKAEIHIVQEPKPENQFIGGKTKFSRFMGLADGVKPDVYVNGERVRGVAFIDFKDCTNTYVLSGDKSLKCTPFYDLSDYQRKGVLRKIHLTVQMKAEAAKKARTEKNPGTPKV